MYNVGDKIVYPMHGAGIIESIEEREILGSKQDYYILKMPIGDMKVMIPTDNVEGIGIREIVEIQEADRVFELLKGEVCEPNMNWNKRYRENMLKIKSGNIFEVTEVVKTLMVRDKEKGLSTGEKKMLNNARQILISELALVKNSSPEELSDMIEVCLDL